MAGTDRSVINDGPDDSDEGFEQGDCSSSGGHPEEPASLPLLRFRRSAEHIFERHLVPKLIQELFCTLPPDVLTRELTEIMTVLTHVAEDSFYKAEVLELIPDVAAQAIESSARVSALKDVVGEYLIPIVVRNLGSCETNVDKAAQTALVQMIKRGHISQLQVEIQVCPAILALSKLDDEQDVDTGAVVLMIRLATLLGRDITERIFLPRFVELCCGSMFYIRKILASRIGTLCTVVGREAFEKMVLPCYLGMCVDEIRDVRKSCAEVMMFVSLMCDAALRRELLAPAFVKLLQDECRWVRMSAFQMLGPFIASFATPPLTRIGTSSSGEAVLVNLCDGCEFTQKGGLEQFSYNSMAASRDRIAFCIDDNADGDDDADADVRYHRVVEGREAPLRGRPDGEQIGTPPTEPGGDDLRAAAAVTEAETKQPPIGGDSSRAVSNAPPSSDSNCDSSSVVNNVNKARQDIVPQDLVDYYVSMCQSRTATEVDCDMSYYCAYSFPAVALTLGRENYPLLHDTLILLSSNMQYKVRRAVASSLHIVADVIGVEGSSEHLVSLFEGFLIDLDEVRVGILKHLSAFLRRVSVAKRVYLLPKLADFLAVENACNWRFREILAEQLTDALDLFRPQDVVKHAGMCSHALLFDNVAAVRRATLSLATEIVKRIGSKKGLKSYYLAMTAERFAHSKKWKARQTFGLLCSRLLAQHALPPQEFASEVLPHLLDLSWDPVANVRLVVAKCLVERILTEEYFMDPANDHRMALETVLRRLQGDKDTEIRRCLENVDLEKRA
ncbi:serine/threonine-protein phosphatase 4 regulatory subunit 1-like isoform X2 [Cylas formicarius]|uniref:serine/threonine-protein phosphatase 4 regulatory subunit 1-like isoform X2 n=1 Tax=Cylas formicarius TaxID=197179 RepID=UPI002958C4AD|nr:serine/threonine-protein phosphatase 4 regulatory subunit 1-like isoform X2 [Cylas formicarius]